MDIEVSLQISLRFEEGKKVSVGNIATKIRDLGLEHKATEAVIHKIDELMVIRCCGEKYNRLNGNNKCQRAGTVCRHPCTSVGRLNLKLHRVKDKKSNKIHLPLETMVEFNGQKVYQEDIAMMGVELATKMTYRDAVRGGKIFTSDFPSACTINRQVIEFGTDINNHTSDNIQDASLSIAWSDSTKTHSQEKDRNKNHVNVVLGFQDGKKALLNCKVNRSWEETAQDLDDDNALDNQAAIIGDADPEMRNALMRDEKVYQLDLIHLISDTSYYLWSDQELSLKERNKLVTRLETIIWPLKNSVIKHIRDKNFQALQVRIDKTVDAMEKLSKELVELRCFKTARFIRKHSNNAVTFAVMAVKGVQIPWNSNIIERLMGEISKRTKHKWMRWTTKGLEAMLNLVLTRYVSEESYQKFKHEIVKGDNLKLINGEVQIINTTGVTY
jgi:hypothetical protein